MPRQLTINDLFKKIKEEIEKGNGNKKIVITNDSEGNGYHGLYYSFTDGNEWGEFEKILEVEDTETTDFSKLVFLG